MTFWNIERRKIMPFIFYLWTIRNGESHLSKDVDDFINRSGENVPATFAKCDTRFGDINRRTNGRSPQKILLTFERGFELQLEFVESLSEFWFLIAGRIFEQRHKRFQFSVCTQVFCSPDFDLRW